MRRTDEILTDLRARAAAGEEVRQQVISHETIARLRAELGTFDHTQQADRARGLTLQIGTHLGLLEEAPADPAAAVEPAPDPADRKRSRQSSDDR